MKRAIWILWPSFVVAGVAELVFTHLVPSPNNFLARRAFLAGVADVFKGKVVVAEDGMRFTLPPK